MLLVVILGAAFECFLFPVAVWADHSGTFWDEDCLLTAGHHCNDTAAPYDQDAICIDIPAHYITLNESGRVINCAECFFPNHCLDENECADGTAGDTCERCIRAEEDENDIGYQPIGSICIPCDKAPWALILLVLLLIPTLVAVMKNGFSVSVYTKLKIILDYLQFLLLTISIRIKWPHWLGKVLKPAQMALLNSQVLNLECYIDYPLSPYYITWMSSMGLPLLFWAVTWMLDSRMSTVESRLGHCERKATLNRRRSQLRRLCMLLLLVYFMPACTAAIHSNACSSAIPKHLVIVPDQDLFLYNQEHSCDVFAFQALSFVTTSLLLCLLIPFPLAILFFTLRSRKWKLLGSQLAIYGSVYETYRKRFVFWEAIPLILKLAAVLVTEIYPFPSLPQCCMMLALSIFYLLGVVIGRPYRKYTWESQSRCLAIVNIHNLLQVMCVVSVCLLQVCAFLRVSLEDKYIDFLDYVAATVILLVLISYVIMMALVHREASVDELEEFPPSEAEGEPEPEGEEFWQRGESGEGVDAKQLQQRKEALNF